VNPRRIVVEERVLSLADAIASESPLLAARLREAVPDDYGLCDEHLPPLRELLSRIAASVPEHGTAAGRILAALDDLPAHIGRRGHVWIGRDWADGYTAHWEDDEDWLEDGPNGVPLDAALAWARRRTDDVRMSDGSPLSAG
jgi:hypothetical protein